MLSVCMKGLYSMQGEAIPCKRSREQYYGLLVAIICITNYMYSYLKISAAQVVAILLNNIHNIITANL